MEKKSNMKQAMYEMFGVGSDQNERVAAQEPSAQTGKQRVQAKQASAAKSVQKTVEKGVDSMDVKPVVTEKKAKGAATYIAPGTVLEGTLRATGDVEIAGEFKGDITAEGAVVMHTSMQGNITAESLKLSACSLNGDVVVKESAYVGAQSKVVGNITAKEVVCAGQINGDLKVTENLVLESTAQVNGNIATGSIAVEKGAIIKGGIEIKPSGM